MTILIIIAQIAGILAGGFLLVGGIMLSSMAGGEISDITAGMGELGCGAMIGGAILSGLCLWGLLA